MNHTTRTTPENDKSIVFQRNRQSIRLPGYDYRRPGAYFITLCVKGRECLFGEIRSGTMRLNEQGEIIDEKWKWLEHQYPYVKLDEFTVMPNHFHGILWIRDISCPGNSGFKCAGGSRTAPTMGCLKNDVATLPVNSMKIKSLGRLVGAFKTISAKEINIRRNTVGESLWQRDFYDRISRKENELFRVRDYIRNNPLNWESDEENPVMKSPRYVAQPNPQRRYL
jgi:putative transposase